MSTTNSNLWRIERIVFVHLIGARVLPENNARNNLKLTDTYFIFESWTSDVHWDVIVGGNDNF